MSDFKSLYFVVKILINDLKMLRVSFSIEVHLKSEDSYKYVLCGFNIELNNCRDMITCIISTYCNVSIHRMSSHLSDSHNLIRRD